MTKQYNKFVSLVIIFIWLSSPILHTRTALADGAIWYDTDGDGLSDAKEISGWYNNNGGSYVTEVNNSDTDGDGLSDGEEQLYSTNPKDKNSPGLYIKYEKRFQTSEYFSDIQFNDDATGYLRWRRAGNHYISMPASEFIGDGNNTILPPPPAPLPNYYDANSTEEDRDVGFVVRRGTTFFIGGDTSQTLTIQPVGFTESSFSITPDICHNGWNVTIPADAYLGTYKATLATSSKSLLIHVIFELPSTNGTQTPTRFSNPLLPNPYINQFISDADRAAFLYNDDSTNPRDETGVTWMTRQGWYTKTCGTSPCDDHLGTTADKTNYYHTSQGYAQAFELDQFKKYIFYDLVINSVKGIKTYPSAVNALADRTDREIRVNYNFVHNRVEIPLRYTEVDTTTRVAGACQDVAAVLVSFCRSAGILARPYITDYKTQKYSGDASSATSKGLDEETRGGWYDHSTMIWDNSNQKWARTRGYSQEEIPLFAYPYNKGYVAYNTTFPGDASYTDRRGDLIITANSGWDYWDPLTQKGMVNKVWSTKWENMEFNASPSSGINYDYYWDSLYPHNMARMHPAVDTMNVPFWREDNWTPNNWTTNRPSGPKYAYGLPAGWYDPTQNWPFEPLPKKCPPYMQNDPSCPYNFPLDAFEVGAESPSSAEPDPQKIQWDELPKIENQKLRTQNQFDGTVPINPEIEGGAKLNDQTYSYPTDTNGDGYVDTLTVEVGVNITQPGTYLATAELFDAQDKWIGSGRGQVSGSGKQVIQLQFNEATGKIGPYIMKRLDLITPRYEFLDSRDVQLLPHAPQLAENGPINIDTLIPTGSGKLTIPLPTPAPSPTPAPDPHLKRIYLPLIQNQTSGIRNQESGVRTPQSEIPAYMPGIGALDATFTPTLVYTVATLSGSDGLYTKLILGVQVNVTTADNYRLEGWLIDPNGDLIALSDDPFALLLPGKQMLTLTFDGRAISNHGVDGPYKIIGLKVLDGNGNYHVLHTEQEPTFKSSDLTYQASQFGPKIIFRDNMENGIGKWISQLFWGVTNQAHSPTNAWQSNAINGQDGSLQSQNINASDYARLGLRFNACYDTTSSANNSGQTQLSQGGSWTTVDTIPISTKRGWNSRFIDLGNNFDQTSNLGLKFLAQNRGSLNWKVDDVQLSGWPAIRFASINFVSGSVGSSPVTLKVNYDAIAPINPLTYTWQFGDGSPNEVIATTNTVVHSFPAISEYPITVTVTSPYDSFDAYILAGGGLPLSDTSFTIAPATPNVGGVVTFTASYLPDTATNTTTNPVRYQWDFGDGSISLPITQTVITHTYQTGGDKQIKLVTSNGYGTTNSSQSITLKEGVSAVTSIFVNPATPIQYDEATFTAQFTPTSASLPVTYNWDFGDGSPAVVVTTTNVQHAYNTVGTFTVTVTAGNIYGTSGAFTTKITTTGKPLQSVIFTPSTVSTYKALLTATYLPISATPPITYFWDFNNDGNIDATTTGPTVTRDFITAGSYTVKLIATNGYSGSVSYLKVINTPFDTDLDGLNDDLETTLGTDPNNRDTDGDGLWDSEEYYGLRFDVSLVVVPLHADSGSLIRIPSDPLKRDTDGDGLNDDSEVELSTGTGCDLYYLIHRCWRWQTHPKDPDTDKDGLTDSEENGIYATSAIKNDTDGDSLNDYVEVRLLGTSGLSADGDIEDGLTVGDGISDLIEAGGDINNPNFITTTISSRTVVYSINNTIAPTKTVPFDTDKDGFIDALSVDADGDTILDKYEYTRSNGSISGCANVSLDQDGDGKPNCKDNDIDGDGLPNYRSLDSDHDGISDKIEGTLDRNINSIPDFLETGPALLGVSFTSSPLVPLANQNVTFISIFTPTSSPQPVNYIWNFGDNSPFIQTTDSTVVHAFAKNGDYRVIVTATNKYDYVSAVYSATIGIGANPLTGVYLAPPTPALGNSDGAWRVRISESTNFMAVVTPSFASRPITYTWNFGDDMPTIQTNTPSLPHTFNSVGRYTITVLAEHAYGPSQTNKLVVTVGRPLTSLTADHEPELLTENKPFTLTAMYLPLDVTAPVSYTWYISTPAKNVPVVGNATKIHTITTQGVYPYIVTATNGYGTITYEDILIIGRPLQKISLVRNLTSPAQHDLVGFQATITPTDPTMPLRYIWSFSNNGIPEKDIITSSTAISRTFDDLGTFSVTVTAVNDYSSISDSQTFMIGGRLLNGINVMPESNSVIDGDTMSFFTTISPTNATQPVTYIWNFGDGTPAITTTNDTIAHDFVGVGNYNVSVKATNGANIYVSANTTLAVNGRALEQIGYSYSPPFLLEGQVMTFTTTPSPISATRPITYTWNFGHGVTLITTSATITHLFGQLGNYNIVLSATNGYTKPVSVSKTVHVEGQPVNEVSFNYGLANLSSDLRVIFTATHQPANATQPIIYEWDFGDGTISSTANITIIHEFVPSQREISQSYTVKVVAHNNYDTASAASHAETLIIPLDSDKDGLGDIAEIRLGTDPHNADTDGDGISDGAEISIKTNPLAKDTDGDGIPDSTEIGLDPSHPRDTDKDGLIDALSLDSDSDTLLDLAEGTADLDGDGLSNYRDSDSDGDGLSDYLEITFYHTDPYLLDSDKDGLTDGQEITAGTNPLKADSDGDGISDWVEIDDYLQPRDTDGDGTIDALALDADGDGILDQNEYIGSNGFILGCTNITLDQDNDGTPNCQDNDIDGDGIFNYRAHDSDNDRAPDIYEGTADRNGNGIPDFLDPTIRWGKFRETFLPIILKMSK